MIPVIICSICIQTELIALMGLSVTVKKFGTAVGVVMSLENDINIVCIKDGSKLGTKDHTICVRMVKTGSVDILVDGYDTPFCIRICFYSFLNGFLMFCCVIVVCV